MHLIYITLNCNIHVGLGPVSFIGVPPNRFIVDLRAILFIRGFIYFIMFRLTIRAIYKPQSLFLYIGPVALSVVL